MIQAVEILVAVCCRFSSNVILADAMVVTIGILIMIYIDNVPEFVSPAPHNSISIP